MVGLYLLTYFLIGTFVHWLACKLEKATQGSEDMKNGIVMFLFMLSWPILSIIVFSIALVELDVAEYVHGVYDALFNKVKDFLS